MTKEQESHFYKMQAMAERFLMPEYYIDRNGRSSNPENGDPDHEKEARNVLFAADMIYMLDGPEQREAFPNGLSDLNKTANNR